MVYCPECEAELKLEDVEKGEIVTCADCGADLEVVGPGSCEVGPGSGGRRRLGGMISPAKECFPTHRSTQSTTEDARVA